MYYKNEALVNTLDFLNKVKARVPFIVYDLETTGKKAEVDYIVQFSAKRFEVVNGVYAPVDSLNLYIKPPIWMDDEVVAIHGITNEFLANKPMEHEVIGQIMGFMRPDAVICGYNIVKFDNKFMNVMYGRYRNSNTMEPYTFEPTAVVDVYSCVKEICSPAEIKKATDSDDKKDFGLKLGNVYRFLNAGSGFSAHSADEDIEATWQVGIALLKRYQKMYLHMEEREPVSIRSMSWFNPSPRIKRIYVGLSLANGVGAKLFYDVATKGWVDVDDVVIPVSNMEYLHQEAEKIAKEQGFEDLNNYTGHWSAKGAKQPMLA